MAYTYGNTQNAAERIKEISGVNPLKCMKCGKCSATCPAFNEMDIKPHQFVTYVQNGDIEALAQSKSLWKCRNCSQKNQRNFRSKSVKMYEVRKMFCHLSGIQ